MLSEKWKYNLLCFLKSNIEFYYEKISLNQLNDDYEVVFQQLPIISKECLIKNYHLFLNKKLQEYTYNYLYSLCDDFSKEYCIFINGEKYWLEFTSGTKGMPFVTIKSEKERTLLGLYQWKLRKEFDYISVNDMFNFMHNKTGKVSFPDIDIDDWYLRKCSEMEYLSKSHYKWWHIFPAQLENYYKIVEGMDIKFPALRVIECNGAYFDKDEKIKWEHAFGCKISNNYGCREVWTIGYTCNLGEIHVNEKSVLVEIVDENDNIVSEGQEGDVVVTSKVLRTLPFVRYRVGDRGYLKKGMCLCGNKSCRLVIVPNRVCILGTSINGNHLFRSVINNIVQSEHLTKFTSINILQNRENRFEVYLCECYEEKAVIERAFAKRAIELLNNSEITFEFFYDEPRCFKSIFTIT